MLIGASHHVDVDTGLQRQGRGFREIGGDAMRDQFGDGVIVADDDAIETPVLAQQIVEQRLVRRHRHAGHIGERRHDAEHAGLHRRLERRQIDFRQRALRNIDLRIVAPGIHRAIGDEMFGDGGKAALGLRRRVLKADDFRLGIFGVDEPVLAGAFADAAPARIAADVEHRREGHLNAVARRFLGRFLRRALPRRAVEGAGFRQGDRIDGAMAVQHVDGEEQRDFQPRLFHRHPLRLADFLGAPGVEKAAGAAFAHHGGGIVRAGRAGFDQRRRQHGKLAELFAESHLRDEVFDPPRDLCRHGLPNSSLRACLPTDRRGRQVPAEISAIRSISPTNQDDRVGSPPPPAPPHGNFRTDRNRWRRSRTCAPAGSRAPPPGPPAHD